MQKNVQILVWCLVFLVSIVASETYSVNNNVDDDHLVVNKEIEYLDLEHTLNADRTVNFSLQYNFKLPDDLKLNGSYIALELFNVTDSEQIIEDSIVVKDLYALDNNFSRIRNVTRHNPWKYSFNPKTNDIVFAFPVKEKNYIQIGFTYKPNLYYECYKYDLSNGIVRRNVSFPLPPSSKPYKAVLKASAGEGLIFDMILVNPSNCPEGWKLYPYPNAVECINNAFSTNGSMTQELSITLIAAKESYLQQQKKNRGRRH